MLPRSCPSCKLLLTSAHCWPQQVELLICHCCGGSCALAGLQFVFGSLTSFFLIFFKLSFAETNCTNKVERERVHRNNSTLCLCKVFDEAAASLYESSFFVVVGTLASANLVLLMSAYTRDPGDVYGSVTTERHPLDLGFLTVCDWTFFCRPPPLCIHFVKGFGNTKQSIYKYMNIHLD